MNKRLDFHKVLKDILGSDNVYFQPPSSIRMKYPAIRYELSTLRNSFADDTVYAQNKAYSVTLIDKNPDSPFIELLSKLPTSRYERAYYSDGLNHYVFVIYY